MSLKIYRPVSGKLIPIENINDPVFSEKMIGDGIGIQMDGDTVKACCDGKINMMFPTGHAFGMLLENGCEILVHIGIETVNENGKGFTILKQENDSVKKGEPIVKVDLEYLKEKYDMSLIIVLTKLNDNTYNINTNASNDEPIIEIQ